tara:strand:- start:222 stop:521 length:300 start_codon:yes stop_codon:yes gene_type:complete
MTKSTFDPVNIASVKRVNDHKVLRNKIKLAYLMAETVRTKAVDEQLTSLIDEYMKEERRIFKDNLRREVKKLLESSGGESDQLNQLILSLSNQVERKAS